MEICRGPRAGALLVAGRVIAGAGRVGVGVGVAGERSRQRVGQLATTVPAIDRALA